MANRRDTFAKRQREADLKERARAKEARRMAKRSEVRTSKGPEFGELAVDVSVPDGAAPATTLPVTPAAASDVDPVEPTE